MFTDNGLVKSEILQTAEATFLNTFHILPVNKPQVTKTVDFTLTW